MALLSPAEIEHRSMLALRRAGAVQSQAMPVAAAVRRAEEDGIGSVGLGYLPTYLAHLRSGRVRGDAMPGLAEPRRSSAIAVDARHGFAHPAFDLGLPHLIAAARNSGVAGLAIARSYSIGVLGHPVEDIAAHGLIGIGFTNSPPNMAAWGSTRKVFGTNPIAVAVPQRDTAPIVIDQATTSVTKVRLAAAAAAGERIPDGWALGPDGHSTNDASRAMAGSIAPFGGAKGANIALLVEILAASLTGAVASRDMVAYARDDGPPPGTGQFFLAIDPDGFADGFLDRISELAGAIGQAEGARLPGMRRLACRARAARDGIEVNDALLARLFQ
jgi:(2R)-3-sulfolactate dehydrogenase (NADP+)